MSENVVAGAGDSPKARATRTRGRRTVASLVTAAVEEFSVHGYRGARIARIAKRAGTAYGTFYLYFADKDDILWESLEATRSDVLDAMNSMPRLEPGEQGREALEEWVYRLCDVRQRNGPMIRVLTEAQSSSPVIGKQGVRSLGAWRGLLSERIRDSDAVGIDPDLAALVIWAALERINYMYFDGSLVASYRELVAATTEFIHMSLFGAGQSPRADPVS